MSEQMDKQSFEKVLDENEQKFNKLFNMIKIKGGYLINLLTFIRFGFQFSHDEGGGFLMLSTGLYRFSITLQFGVDE